MKRMVPLAFLLICLSLTGCGGSAIGTNFRDEINLMNEIVDVADKTNDKAELDWISKVYEPKWKWQCNEISVQRKKLIFDQKLDKDDKAVLKAAKDWYDKEFAKTTQRFDAFRLRGLFKTTLEDISRLEDKRQADIDRALAEPKKKV